MLEVYRWVLRLYPDAYRRDYAEEMFSVFRDAETAMRRESVPTRFWFRVREIKGLLSGAVREHLCGFIGGQSWIPFGRFDMRSEFRFPRSTISLMLVILAGVVLTIEKAKGIQEKYGAGTNVTSVWSTLPQSLLVMVIAMCVLAAAGWAILFALRRSGVHRLSNVQTWPEQR